MLTRRLLLVMGLLALVFSAKPAPAAPLTWNFLSPSCVSSGAGDGNTRTCLGGPAGAPAATASAWADTGGPSNLVIENALLEVFSSGLGVRNRDRTSGDTGETSAPQHAIDNANRNDSVFFAFGDAVVLNEVTIGYASGDSDITVLAYAGSGTPPLGGNTYGSLTGLGWMLIGHYSNLATGAGSAINAGGFSSAY